jgi:hypothetical protein
VHVDSPRPIAERRVVPRWFQPAHLSRENLVSKFAFQMGQRAPLRPATGGISTDIKKDFKLSTTLGTGKGR